MRSQDISAYVLAYNESANIARCLNALSWVARVVVVDSISTDGTQQIASVYPNVEVVERPFDNLRNQHSYGMRHLVDSPWVLRLDADWIVSRELMEEILGLTPDADVAGIRVPFRLAVYGREVPIAVYPPVVCLFRPDRARYVQDGHTERLVAEGRIMSAKAFMTHDDRKLIDRFFESQLRYSKDELQKLRDREDSAAAGDRLSLRTRIKYALQGIPGASAVALAVYLGILKLGFFRGPHSRHYIIERVVAELFLALRVIDERIRGEARDE